MGVHYRYSPQGCVATDSIVADKLLTSADSGGVTPDTSPPPLPTPLHVRVMKHRST